MMGRRAIRTNHQGQRKHPSASAAPGLKYKAALSVAYGAGLRVSEIANLKVSGGRMSVVETFARGAQPRSFKADAARIDTS